MKNYENHKAIPEAIDLKYIKENFPLAKIILTYQRYKIFFTYEDFSNYFYTSYTDEPIDECTYPEIEEFTSKLEKINNTTFNKIYNAFKSNTQYKTLESEIQKENMTNNNLAIINFVNIYKTLESNPRIYNYLNNKFNEQSNYINDKNKYLNVITNKIHQNNLFIKFKNIDKNDKQYFENVLDFFKMSELPNEFEGKEFLEEILQKHPEYFERLKEIIYNSIMDKINIKYNDQNNEDYNYYCIQIKNKLVPQNTKSFSMKNVLELTEDNLFIEQKFKSLNKLQFTNDETS